MERTCATFTFFSLVLFLILCMLLKMYDTYLKCNLNHIKDVCQSYENQLLNDSFCEKLCLNKIITYQKCHSVNHEKIVHEVILNGRQAIIKFDRMLKGKPGEWDFFSRFNNSDWSVFYYGHCGDIYAVESALYTAGDIFGSADLLADLIFVPDALLPLTEFLTERFPKSNIMASKLNDLSTYFSEVLYRHVHQLRVPSLKEKLEFLKNVFAMLANFMNSTNGDFLMCDFHLANFGLMKDGRVALIDVDYIFTLSDVKGKLSSQACKDDWDCRLGDFDDCRSYCNNQTNICSTNVALSNVHNLCKIVLGLVFHQLTDNELDMMRMSYRIVYEISTAYSKSVDEEMVKIALIRKSLDKVELN